MSAIRLGILAEDETDGDALAVLVRRIAGHTAIGLKKQSFGGCARLRAKAAATLKRMVDEGCAAAVLVHDLDRDPNNGELNDEATLRRQLETIARPAALACLVCIPVEELEAWFWSDPGVLSTIGPGAKAHPSPHLIRRPKEKLIALSRGDRKKARYTTLHNKVLAERLDLDLCAARCPAFRQLRDFVGTVLSSS
jgi:hypothetical protein